MKTYKCYRDQRWGATACINKLELNGHSVLNNYYSESRKQWVISYIHKEDLTNA